MMLVGVNATNSTDTPNRIKMPNDPLQQEERTCFQTGTPYSPRIDLRSDVAICYGIGPNLPSLIQSWKRKGYIVEVMTGVAWGNYQDYLYGRFDGKNHVDEAQTDRNGNKISHGGDVYYMCPGPTYGDYLSIGVKRAIDAGAEAIFLEEPEFWVRAGYSEGFKREWQSYYHEPWQPPYTSVDAQYRASKLKYYLYRRALEQVFNFVHQYNRQTERHVRCYVATHSLINYAHWGIVSPESSLIRVGTDGYIAQVWTGTSRTPNMYEGRLKERTFETAFLEYGAMQNLVRASGRRVWYLNDPVEDNPNHSWKDYRTNWESTLTASLLQPEVWRYEVMPWPDRVFNGRYPVKELSERKPGEAVEREPIPAAYATELQLVINALNDMKQPDWRWSSGTQKIGVVVSDTMMFERGDPDPGDPHLSSFYGLALPLVKWGIPVEPVQLEDATELGFLNGYRVLLMTYEGMKPMEPQVDAAIAQWVRAGGALIFVDADKDPYNQVREWWNENGLHFATPRLHLWQELGLTSGDKPGTYHVGRGWLIYSAESPSALAYQPEGASMIRGLVREACDHIHLKYDETSYLILRRGPYVVAAGLNSSLQSRPRVLRGTFINLFDPTLKILRSVTLSPGRRLFLVDLNRVDRKRPMVVASAAKAILQRKGGSIQIYVEGIAGTNGIIMISDDKSPTTLEWDGMHMPADSWSFDKSAHTLRFQFQNDAKPHVITLINDGKDTNN